MSTRILLKTTIGPVADDWHVGPFSLLRNRLRSLKDSSGSALYQVVARDRIEVPATLRDLARVVAQDED